MIMMGLYSLILAASAAFAAWAGERVFTRVLREMDAPDELSQVMVALAAIAFFVVVALPAAMVIGALLLLVLGALKRPTPPGLVIAVLLGLYGLAELHSNWPMPLPFGAWWDMSGVIWFALLLPATRVQPSQWVFSVAIIFSALPLALAALFFPAVHGSMALDVAILSAALLGGVLSPYAAQPATLMLRLVGAFLLGGLIVQTLHYGAWPVAVLSAGLWLVSMFWLKRKPVFEAQGVAHV